MLGHLFGKRPEAEQKAPDQRRELRLPVSDGTVEIDGRPCPLVNWSYTGFLARNYTGDKRAGDKVTIAFSVTVGEGRCEFECLAMLVRVDRASQKVVGAFVDMDAATRAKIARYVG